ncbi:SCO2525 family SAM-dependent methyltransferase [Parafrankia sp. EUN1f]|uniref:SCO2525 family SAM-dependent methyltransferase n=1 Tax=Parafrankia sp. EUN1f TaxID=102897 RepID=UPI0001C43F25|nr:SCO2525 family SAM-dependent methyltransferase [Parafrankia sp. EUN1f]EFC83082.1 Methyltransferase NNMT/PNMT/TEMT [Parafrankia sp. EUN1f]
MVEQEPSESGPAWTGNSKGPWDLFDPKEYHGDNYAVLRDDDREIIEGVRDFFVTFAAEAADGPTLRGLDVGSGSNLYPALTMLPWCRRLTLVEFSAKNVEWLRDEVQSYGSSWDPFWDVLSKERAYADAGDPRRALAERTEIRRGSVFDLPRARWDIGTMFFVACSISTLKSESERAARCFLDALVPGAPFAMAYMEKSSGYSIGGVSFPAVPLSMAEIGESIEGIVTDLETHRIETEVLLREGYEAMVLVRGRTRREPVGPEEPKKVAVTP